MEQVLHAGFGIAVMGLTVLQVIAGMVRPGPDSDKRLLFNRMHRLSGLVTYILAAITMFIGSRISYMTDRMLVTGTGLLAGLVVVQVFYAVLMEISACRGNRYYHRRVNYSGS